MVGMWIQILFSLLLGVVAWYFYSTRNNDYWKKKGLPYVPPVPFLGSLSNPFNAPPLSEWDNINYKKYGRLFGFFEGSRPRLMVADPELIQTITIKDFHVFPNRRGFNFTDEISINMLSVLKGEQWKKMRTAMSAAFSSGKMRKMAPLINECIEIACSNLQKAVDKGQSVDLKRIFGAFSMDVVATVFFGAKLNSLQDPNNPFVLHAKNVFSQDSKLKMLMLYAFPKLGQLLGFHFFGKENLEFFKRFTEDIIRKRKQEKGVKRFDLLQLLLNDVSEAKRMLAEDQNENGNKDSKETKGLSEIEIAAQCVLFFIAGYDTAASTLSFLAYNLALNPECQEKLAVDVQKMLKENDNVIDYDTIKKLPYLDAVVSETLRLFPPGERLERTCVQDYVIGDTGVTIPKGMVVAIPTFPIHHDPEFFPDPEKFDPQRFFPENRDAIKPYTYIPFGSGPRICIAERLALLEIKLCLTRVISKFKFLRTPETKVPPKIYVNQGVLVPHEIILKVERRD